MRKLHVSFQAYSDNETMSEYEKLENWELSSITENEKEIFLDQIKEDFEISYYILIRAEDPEFDLHGVEKPDEIMKIEDWKRLLNTVDIESYMIDSEVRRRLQ